MQNLFLFLILLDVVVLVVEVLVLEVEVLVLEVEVLVVDDELDDVVLVDALVAVVRKK